MSLDPITAVAGLVDTVVNKIFPDKTEAAKAKAALDMTELVQNFQLILGQLEINKVEAASSSKFTSGWRPFIGWVCGFAFAWQYVLGPIAVWLANLLGKITTLPNIDTTLMIQLLLAMLGLGGLRTYEKITKSEGNR